MRCRALFLVLLFSAAPLLAAGGHAGEGSPVLGVFLKVLNVGAFFGLLIFLMARPLRGFFEKQTEGIRASLDASRSNEREALELEAKARDLAASVEGEVAVLKERFASDRERVREEIEGATGRALARLRADHARSLSQMEAAFRSRLVSRTLQAAREEALGILAKDLTPADRARFLETVTAEREGA
jgi:F0F1-type ATP synthase membrane subunit b/b'